MTDPYQPPQGQPGQPGPQGGPGQPSYGAPQQQPYGAPQQQPYGFPPAPSAPQGAPVGPGGMILDQASGLYLPPGVQLAPVGRRIGAYFLAIPLVIVTLGIGYVIWGLVLWGKGTTPALKVLGMKCWDVNEGRVPGFGKMALREIIGRIVDGILSIITALISFILFVTGVKRQSLHDMVASTTVVYDPNKVLG